MHTPRTEEEFWHPFLLGLAEYVSRASKDPSTKCGAVIVRQNHGPVSWGYNGFPRRCDDSPEIYANRDLKLARVIHAEQNAILNAREPLDGYTMYSSVAPCDRCAAHIIQAGIIRVVFPQWDYAIEKRWGDSLRRGLDTFREAGVELVVLTP